MPNNKHLTLDERNIIESLLTQKVTFTEIARTINKHPSTISKEIRCHLSVERVGGGYRNYNACALRFSCEKSRICSVCHSYRKYKKCKSCSMCNRFCKDFKHHTCNQLSRPPYVCNFCSKRSYCTLEKRFYKACVANTEYRLTLSETRTGISLSEEDIRYLDDFISPLIKKQQSPHHICVTNRDSIMVSERTIYRLIESSVFSARNLDLPRKVRFKARKKTVQMKVDKGCRIGRNYECFTTYLKEHPNTPRIISFRHLIVPC